MPIAPEPVTAAEPVAPTSPAPERPGVGRPSGQAAVDPIAPSNPALGAYARRQAATVGRGGASAPAWVPALPQADGACLGLIEGFGGINACGLALAADGARLFTGQSNGRVRCWDLRAGTRVWDAAEHHRRGVQDVALAVDGSFLATSSDDGTIRLWDARTGAARGAFEGHTGTVWSVRIAPDGQRVLSGARDGTARLWDVATGREQRSLTGHGQPVWSVAFSPDGRIVATGSADRSARLWDAASGAELGRMDGHEETVWSVAFSPDGRLLATGSSDRSVRLWDTETLQPVGRLLGHEHGIACVAFSPDGRFLASSSSDRSVRLWDARTCRQQAAFQSPEDYAWRVVWAPSGAFVASSHHRDIVRLWDTRPVVSAGRAPETGALPPELAGLPAALAATLRAGFVVPLSLVRDLLALTGGAAEPAALAGHAGMRALAHLGWPEPARVALALVVLALAGLSSEQPLGQPGEQPPGQTSGRMIAPEPAPPAGVTPAEIQLAVAEALAGPAIAATPVPVPEAALRRGLDRVDDRVITLLAGLGAAACARDPALPLALLGRLSDIVPLHAPERDLLGRRLPTDVEGQAEGTGFGPVRQGITHRGELRSLLPSGWALPPKIRAYRHRRGELLYRARAGREAPRIRPVVIVLDVSAACVGAVARTVRVAAHVMARTLIDARVPGFALVAGGANTVRALEHGVDAFELLVARSASPGLGVDVDVGLTLAQAGALCESLRDTGHDAGAPMILLVTHGFFGAEVEDDHVSVPPHLRALFVQYPGHGEPPPWRHACERWEAIAAGQTGQVTGALARLLS